MTLKTCGRPLRGGMNISTSSVNTTAPTRSLFLIAENARRAPISATTSRLKRPAVPKSAEPLASTTNKTVSSRSSTNFFTCSVPVREVTFQSMVRTSSPSWYSRTSENSIPRPLKTL